LIAALLSHMLIKGLCTFRWKLDVTILKHKIMWLIISPHSSFRLSKFTLIPIKYYKNIAPRLCVLDEGWYLIGRRIRMCNNSGSFLLLDCIRLHTSYAHSGTPYIFILKFFLLVCLPVCTKMKKQIFPGRARP